MTLALASNAVGDADLISADNRRKDRRDDRQEDRGNGDEAKGDEEDKDVEADA